MASFAKLENMRQERILITDMCRGNKYPKQFTTYRIVSVNDSNTCLGVEIPPDFVREPKYLVVVPCKRETGILIKTIFGYESDIQIIM